MATREKRSRESNSPVLDGGSAMEKAKRDGVGTTPQFQQLREEKKQRLRALYEQLDVDKDGKVDVKELAAALKKRVPNAAEASSYAQRVMDQADTSLDAGIDFNEFVAYILEHERKLAVTFGELDRNKNGVIDFHEVKKHLEDLGMSRVTDSQAKEIIARMTMNENHSVGLDEFQHYFFLHPSASSADIAEYWHRTLFIDIGEQAAAVPEAADKRGWWKHLLAGGVAGAVSRTSTAPLDRLKIFLQVHASHENGLGVVSSLRYLLKEGGLKALWRGNGVNVVKIIPESAIKFWSYEQAKVLIASSNRTGRLSGAERFVAGSAAGVVSQTAVYPMEVLKTRLALRKTGEMNRGAFDALRTVYRTDGARAFFRGYLPNLIGIVPYAGTEMAVYETLKNLCIDRYFANEDPGLVVVLGCGMVSSTIAQTVSYPLALVRTRLQAHAGSQPDTMLGQFKFIMRQEGFGGLYRGLVPNFLKVLPSVSISYVVYEAVRRSLGAAMT